MTKKTDFDYELIDCGHGQRIERFGEVIVNRPCPQAEWPLQLNEVKSDAFFVREHNKRGWEFEKKLPETWKIQVGKNVRAELRFSRNSQVGIFPEQLNNWQWIAEKINQNKDRPLKILNAFAYTGMATLFASAEHTEVVHLDGAKSALNWANRNAEISGMSDHHIRWICDDVQKFMTREIKRGNKYDGIILDPPAFGRGKKNEWKIERDLPKLMRIIANLLTDQPLFVLLTCHAPEHFLTSDLVQMLEEIPHFQGKKAEGLLLDILSKNGNSLPSSFGARISS